MGKTSIVKKAAGLLREVGHTVVYVSAETSTLDAFTESLMTEIRREARLRDRISKWETELAGEAKLSVAGNGFKLSGKLKKNGVAVETDFFALCGEAAAKLGHVSVVICIDEISVLANALHSNTPGAASEFLHSLRRSRQSLKNVSIVLACSVGLHHAVKDLTPLSDLAEVRVAELSCGDAEVLAQRLLVGCFGLFAGIELLAREIALRCSYIPYYIHRLIFDIEQNWESPPASTDIGGMVYQSIAENAWGTDHYYDRIHAYYGRDAASVVACLDAVCAASSCSMDELAAALPPKQKKRPLQRHELGLLMRTMQRDHYLKVVENGYAINTDLLRLIWSITRERR